MKKAILFSGLFLLLFPQAILAGKDSSGVAGKKHLVYFSWGYNKGWFSKSDIRFFDLRNNSYDFTLENTKAKDRPGFRTILSSAPTIPQYVYRIGIYFKEKKIGLEINFDHAKYVMTGDQTVHVKGHINHETLDKDTLLHYKFVSFEHTNGANYLMINALNRFTLFSPSPKSSALFSIRSGGGICIPKTDATLFGQEKDAPFHIAGYVIGIEAGPRYEFLTHFFLEATAKAAFVNFYDVLTVNGGRAKHHYFTAEAILTTGFLLHF